ncbi:MAG: T9SS type A sorting domain-containing protein, partial [Calditrichaeota bacterium]|nr:T9SS type A sorting domain-containing protein [Calditrichota bacterium]
LPTSSSLEVAIYNLAGRKIETLVKGHYTAGYHTLIWEAGSVSAGTYLINVKAGEYSATRKIVLLR